MIVALSINKMLQLECFIEGGIKKFKCIEKDPEGVCQIVSRILVVDDERDMCRMVSSILKEEGYSVDKAYDAAQAIKKISTRGYDLMILDYKLPRVSGVHVLAEARWIRPSLKVIMISAYGSPYIKTEVKKFKIYKFMDKPFDLNRLVEVVNKALAKKSRGEVNRSSSFLKAESATKGGERKWQLKKQ